MLQQGQLVLPRRVVTGDLVLEDGVIAQIAPRAEVRAGDDVVDARGSLVLPGLIDAQARFRAYTRKGDEDLHSGSLAAVKGGVTSVLEVPDDHPDDAHDRRTLAAKLELARESCVIDHGLWVRARPDNLEEVARLDGVVGARLALDCSEGQREHAERWFAGYPHVLAVHAEDRGRLASRYAIYTENPDVTLHHHIRDVETVVRGTRLALDLAARHGTRLHLFQLTSEEEVRLVVEAANPRVTAGVTLPHLAFDAADVEKVGARLQCNPPIRTARHREALWRALQDGSVPLVCSDHCPQGLSSKRVPYPHSASGMPTIEWLLPAMLTAREARGFALTDLARWLSDAPARAFGLARKGRLEVGYDADVVLVDPCMEREVTDSATLSRAGWSPFAGRILRGWPRSVWAHGRAVLRDGELFPRVRGRPLNPLSRSPSP
ncbi:MAG: amidohydrolase family protein [Myxococcales bacterium]|nr:amidohydrolase family protein [Myxococcales bacterium]